MRSRAILLVAVTCGMLTASRADYLWLPASDPKLDAAQDAAIEALGASASATNAEDFAVRALSHREWLVIGLMRADFKLAARHANWVVRVAPNDVRANFALGMNAYQAARYNEAARHLMRCKMAGSVDPAILNNLALAQMHLGHYADARKNVEAALKRYPQIPQLKNTLESINAAEKDNPKPAPKPEPKPEPAPAAK